MLEDQLVNKIKKSILARFSSVQAIIIWGSAVSVDFIKESGDIDLIIVIKNSDLDINNIQKELSLLRKEFTNEVDLDPALTTLDRLKTDLSLITIQGVYDTHGIDRYIINHQSKVVYGNKKILKLITDISFRDALKDVLPYIKDVFIKEIREELPKIENLKSYLEKKANFFYMIIRAIYNLETKKIGSKLEVLKYVETNYSFMASLCVFLKKNYLKQDTDDISISKDIIERFLNLAEKKINRF